MNNELILTRLSKREKGYRNPIPFLCTGLFLFVFLLSPALGSANSEVPAFRFVELLADVDISGTVMGSEGEPLVGVTVQVEGSTLGTTTDVNGNFSLAAPENSTLIFSYLGYKTQSVTVGTNNQTLNIEMEPESSELNQLVVIGYGTQRREAVTGSVASIGGKELNEIPSSNIVNALQGRLPGVEMSQTSTQPGSSMQIRIRGVRSLSASNDPLIVLDGIPFGGSISDIDPNNVESIDILKDASATAIYGSRGANGVILIQTRQAQKGQGTRITLDSYTGIKDIFAKYPMMNGPEFAEVRKVADMYSNGSDEKDFINTDWQDRLYRTGFITSHNLNISSGTEKGSYSFGGGYFQDQSPIPNQQFDRYALNGKFDQQVGEYLRFGLSTNTSFSVSKGNQVGLYNTLSMSPLASPFNDDGTRKRTIRMPLDEQWAVSRQILEDNNTKWLSEARTLGSYNNLFGEVKIPWVENLSYRVNVGLDYTQRNGGGFTAEGIGSSNPTSESSASVSNAHTYHWVVEHLINYDKTFGEKHNLNFVGLYSAEREKYVRSSMSAKDIPSDAFRFYNLGQALGEITVGPDGQTYQQTGLNSWMGRAMYSFDNRYMLSAAIRSDGSSRLAPGHRWHTYPAVSAGWNIGNESFMEHTNWLEMLKLRAGYGQTSNQAVAPYSTLGGLTTSPYNFGDDTYATGYSVSRLPNFNLGWEFSDTWNFGIDFSLFNYRLTGTVEYYITKTRDILLNVNLPQTSGVGSFTNNIGKTQNKGWELALDGVILDDVNGWTWTAGVNMYGNKNRLVQLASGSLRDESNWWFVGHPINVIYDYQKIGIWQEEDPYLSILEPGGNVGMIKVKYDGDYDEHGAPTREIGPDDRQIMSVDPKFEGGFNTTVTYKGFDLTAVGIFRSGGLLISTLYSASGYLNMLNGRRNNVKVDYWTPENTGGKYPLPGGVMSGDNPKYGNSLGYFNSSYLKFRTISLGYDFAQSQWLENSGLQNLRLYFTVQNPFVLFSPFHKESGLDPETNSMGDQGQFSATTGMYPGRLLTLGTNTPVTRNYIIGINLTF